MFGNLKKDRILPKERQNIKDYGLMVNGEAFKWKKMKMRLRWLKRRLKREGTQVRAEW